MKRIYFDNNASTAMDPATLEFMVQVLESNARNPSALHAFGREGRRWIEDARDRIAEELACSSSEILFTSGATEANHLALRSLAAAAGSRRRILVSPLEHPSVLSACQALEKRGFELVWLPVQPSGVVDIETAATLLDDTCALTTMMWVNNETGVIQPVEEWAELCASEGVPFHCDAVQACGRIPVKAGEYPITTFSASAHKFHGPQGVGFLFVRKGFPVHPIFTGGAQERGRRAGTENTAGIAAMAHALDQACGELEERREHVERLGAQLTADLRAAGVSFALNGDGAARWPGCLNLRFAGAAGEALLMQLDLRGIAVSVGSACSSGSLEPSHVLEAMGVSVHDNLSSLRVSFSHQNTSTEVGEFVAAMKEILSP